MLQVRIKRLSEDAIVPKYKTEGSAGADLYAAEDVLIPARETETIKTGISLELRKGYCGLVQGRSGLSISTGYHVKTGTIDSDYRGEICVIVSNTGTSDVPLRFQKGDRIAQLIILPVVQADFIESEALSITERGANGFGSTGLRG